MSPDDAEAGRSPDPEPADPTGAPGDLDRLRRLAPFDGLPETSIRALADAVRRRAFAAGATVIADGADPLRSPTFAILSGRVRLVETERRTTIRHLRPGEIFGHFALLHGLPPPYRAEVSHAGELLEFERGALLAAFERHPVFAGWFRADLRRFERELGAFDDVAGGRFLFGQRLGELERAEVPSCDARSSIRAVAREMSERDRDCALVVEAGRAVGLVSDADLRDRVVAGGLSAERPVREAMDPDPPRIRARASVFEGMMAMERHGRRHLVLLDEAGVPGGVLSDTDLARTLLSSPAALRRRVVRAGSAAELRELRGAADRMIVTLFRRGVRAEDLLTINTRFNDALTERVLGIAAAGLSAPPGRLRWCWLALGSEGRGEMGLRTDQDNALVHACPAGSSAATIRTADAWLGELAATANALLDAAGIAFCDGGIMAREPPLRRDLAGWAEAMRAWMSDPDDVRLLRIGALADARPVHGDATLWVGLRDRLRAALDERPGFLRTLAREALVPELPARRFPVPRLKGAPSGQDGPTIDLKRHGTHPVVNAARLLCLETGWLDRSATGERLEHLTGSGPALGAVAREAAIAWAVLADLRLGWQVEQVDRGETPRDVMPLARLGQTRTQLLLGAYRSVEGLRDALRLRFGAS